MCDINDIKYVFQYIKNMMILHPRGSVAFGSAVSLVTAYSLLIVYYAFLVNGKSQTFGWMAYITFLLCVFLSLLLRAIVQYMSAGAVVVRINVNADGARLLLEHIIEAALANNRVNEDEIVDEGIETDVEDDNVEEDDVEDTDYVDGEEVDEGEHGENEYGVFNN